METVVTVTNIVSIIAFVLIILGFVDKSFRRALVFPVFPGIMTINAALMLFAYISTGRDVLPVALYLAAWYAIFLIACINCAERKP